MRLTPFSGNTWGQHLTRGDVANLEAVSVTSQRDESSRTAYFCTLEQVKRKKGPTVWGVRGKATEAQYCEKTLVKLTVMIC